MYNTKTQNDFLSRIRNNNKMVTIFLINGFRLNGTIKYYDDFCIVLQYKEDEQLVYKSGISAIVKYNPINKEKNSNFR